MAVELTPDPNSDVQETKHWVHLDPNRTDYTLSESEMRDLENATDNHWKDLCILFFGIGISTGSNAVSNIGALSTFELTLSIFLNSVISILCLLLSIILGVAWYKTGKNLKEIFERIKNKPKFEVNKN